MNTYDLYGYIIDSSIETARDLVEHCLNIKLQGHESLFYGGEYYRHSDIGKEHFILQKNYDSSEHEWMEEDYKEYPILLYVNEINRELVLEKVLTDTKRFKLLRRELL